MSYSAPEAFTQVTATCKANIYFDGKVISHTLTLTDGSKKTLGLIYPGSYTFNTDAPEKMEIIAGACRVRIVITSYSIHYTKLYDWPCTAKAAVSICRPSPAGRCSFLPPSPCWWGCWSAPGPILRSW